MFYGSILIERTEKATKIHKCFSVEQNESDSLRSHHPRSRGGQENESAVKISKNLQGRCGVLQAMSLVVGLKKSVSGLPVHWAHQRSFQFYLLSEFPFLMLMKGENPKLPPNIPTLLLHSILIHHLFWFKCKYIMFGHKQVRLLSRD